MDIDVPSAVEVSTTLRYINLHLLTSLLTYLLAKKGPRKDFYSATQTVKTDRHHRCWRAPCQLVPYYQRSHPLEIPLETEHQASVTGSDSTDPVKSSSRRQDACVGYSPALQSSCTPDSRTTEHVVTITGRSRLPITSVSDIEGSNCTLDN